MSALDYKSSATKNPPQQNIIDTRTAAGIYDLRRLKIKHCAELVGAARSVLDFCLSITQNVQVTGFHIRAIRVAAGGILQQVHN